MKMKKAFAAILAGTMCAGMLVGCGASQATQSDSETDRAVKVSDYDGEITLVIATKDEFLGTLDNAVKAAAEINNVELHSVDCGADQDKQNDAVRAAAEKDEARFNEWLDAQGLRGDVVHMRAHEAPITLLRGEHRWQLFLKMYFKGDVNAACARMQAMADAAPEGVRAELEVNPANLY